MVRTYKLKTERRSLDEERMKTTIYEVTSKVLSIRIAAEKYGIKPATLQHRVEKIRKASGDNQLSSSNLYGSKYSVAQVFTAQQEKVFTEYLLTCSIQQHSFQQLNDHIQKRLSMKKHLRKEEKKENPGFILTHRKKIDGKQRKREVKLMKQKYTELKTAKNLLRLTETKKPKKIKDCLRLKPDSDSSENEFLKLSDDDDDEESYDRGEEEFDIPNPENINWGFSSY